MKPLMLKIKGFNSFMQEQAVDFEKLTRQGLFGVLGPTGSGKSSLLDAMTMVLYGKLARKSKDFINKESDTAVLSLLFQIGVRNPKVYLVERSYKNDPAGGFKTVYARLAEVDGITEEKKILAEKSTEVTQWVEKIIGLNYVDFSRCVILPQGKFADFLHLAGKERNETLERIFQLEAYGGNLHQKIREGLRAQEQKLQIVRTEINQYDRVNPEALKQQQMLKAELLTDSLRVNAALEAAQSKFNVASELWQWRCARQDLRNRQSKLLQEREKRNKNEENLKRAKEADLIIPLSKKLEQDKKGLKELAKQISELEIQNTETEKKLLALQLEKQQADVYKEQHYETLITEQAKLEAAMKIKGELSQGKAEIDLLLKEYKEKQKNNQQLEAQKINFEADKKALKIEISKIEMEIEQLKGALTERLQVQQGADLEKEQQLIQRQAKSFQEKVKTDKDKIDIIVQQIQNYENSLEALQHQSQKNTSVQYRLIKGGIDFLNSEKLKIADEKNQIAEKRKTLNEERQDHQYQLLAYQLAQFVEPGLPCPVCGSCEHPDIQKNLQKQQESGLLEKLIQEEAVLNERLQQLDRKALLADSRIAKLQEDVLGFGEHNTGDKPIVKKRFEQYESLIRQLQNMMRLSLEEMTKIQNKLIQLHHEKKVAETSADEAARSLAALDMERIEGALTKLQKSVTMEGTFEDKLKELNQKEQQAQQKETQLKSLKNRADKAIVEIERFNALAQAQQIELNELLVTGREKRAYVEKLEEKIKEYSHINDFETELHKNQVMLQEILNTQKRLNGEFETMQQKSGVMAQNLKVLNNEYQIKEAYFKKDALLLEEKLAESSFSDVSEVECAYLKPDEQKRLEESITAYEEDTKLIHLQLADVENKINGREITAAELAALEKDILKYNEEKQTNTEYLAVLNSQIDLMGENLQKLDVKKKEHELIQKRLDQYTELANLFAGNKFIEFIAESKLNYVAKDASRRLKEMTKGRYAIELDDTSFVIRDDGNGGIRRSTQTLSGGEVFLTSLCLALALSSRIQLKNNAPLEFFFLDEGFGSLDNEYIDMAMNSLENLRTQNLCVGLITHVEEIKNRIQAKLMVYPARQYISGSQVKIEIS